MALFFRYLVKSVLLVTLYVNCMELQAPSAKGRHKKTIEAAS